MNGVRRAFSRVAAITLMAMPVRAQGHAVLPAGLEPQTRQIIEQLADSLHAVGLPADPLYAKAAEGKLKQATDAQIVVAVRSLARRFGEIRAGLGESVDAAAMSAAATALSAGVPLSAIKGLRDAAGGPRDTNADFATALVTLTDLVSQRVAATAATLAVQSLLARRAPADQYARLRIGVTDDIVAGRSPDQAVRARAEAIVRSLPAAAPGSATIKPPPIW
jgi:hypothetical protein